MPRGVARLKFAGIRPFPHEEARADAVTLSSGPVGLAG